MCYSTILSIDSDFESSIGEKAGPLVADDVVLDGMYFYVRKKSISQSSILLRWVEQTG
jgi:hypothetical protein